MDTDRLSWLRTREGITLILAVAAWAVSIVYYVVDEVSLSVMYLVAATVFALFFVAERRSD